MSRTRADQKISYSGGRDDGEAADLLVRSGDNLVHGDHLTMSGRTKPMRPRASTMPAPMIMLVKRRPATSG